MYYLKVKDGTDNNITYHIDTNYKWYEKKEEIPEAEFDNFEKVYFRIQELSNQGLVPIKKQLKEEFKYLDVEKILSTLESADLIFKGKQ